MAKWKELGEVPDSDDEGDFDSHESQDQEELTPVDLLRPDNDGTPNGDKAHGESQAVAPAGEDDIWDIPPSSPLPRPDRGNEDVPVVSSSLEPPPDSTPPWPQSSPPLALLDEVKNGNIIVDLPPPPSPGAYIQTSVGEEEPCSTPTADIDGLFTNPASAVVNVLDEPQLSTQDAGSYSRSLRPRKPIQEHPYLLESAQYSKLFKSHGVRPVRVQIEEAARKAQEEDSQEQDYEEDSQSTAKDPGVEESGESQAIDRSDPFDLDDIVYELGLSPERRQSPPRNPAPVEDPIRSSQDEEDEFPDLADIAKWKLLSATRKIGKRHASPKTSTKRKVPKRSEHGNPTNAASPLRRPIDIFDIPPSPPQTSPGLFSTTPLPNMNGPKPARNLTPKPSSATPSLNHSPAPANRGSRPIDLTASEYQDNGLDQGDDEVRSNHSDNETHALLQNSRRIRGVLPASWLRLDQQTARQTPKKANPRRSLDRSPKRSHRKGVAQRRQVSPKRSMDNPFFFDDSDDDGGTETNLRLNDINDLPNDSPILTIEDDDAGSVVEENLIDYMLPGVKRTSSGLDGPERPKKKRKHQQATFKGQPDQRQRQQRITGLLGRTKSSSSTGRASKASHASTVRPKERPITTSRPRTPPRLSILDVAEPSAPAFIRIAARTARRRPDKGRASPSTKRISLGTRKDHREATEVLTDWKRGKIKPKLPAITTKTQRGDDNPPPVRPVSHSSDQSRPRPVKPRVRKVIPSSRFSQPTRSGKQASMDNFVSIEIDVEASATATPQPSDFTDASLPTAKPRASIRRRNTESAAARPAQLETAGETVGRYAFTARKKALDALYRRSRKVLPAPVNVRLEKVVESNFPDTDADTQTSDDLLFLELSEAHNEAPEPAPKTRRLKSRKRTKPQHLDTSAPQYAHANDPLPWEVSPVVEVTDVPGLNTKLLGLGPFGTHYTQHFEVFPLDQGVFFHESTLLGSGRVAKALESSLDGLDRSRGRTVFVLDEKNLQWGSWDAQTSSEFGIVCDWIADRLGSTPGQDDSPRDVMRAALFILDYLQNSLSFPDQESQKAFANRSLEVLRGYLQRLEALPTNASGPSRSLVQVLSCCLVTVSQVLRTCRKLDLLSESLKLEELLKDVARYTSRRLLKTHLADIRSLYDDLQNSSYRERGIRDDKPTAVCWVVLIRVLEGIQIPRSGFWDLVSPTIPEGDVGCIADAHAFDSMWHNLFTLLPLGEFDNTGILVSGTRNSLPLEGWWLPQRLVNRVFQLYKSNPRQSPSFNDYCRGIVGRCHYLAEQWGWRKCNGIVGTIFDFFASQDLSHLRNEEAYRSPQFLEDLATSPSLAIVPEDRCFHIFLKLLALSIKRLRRFGQIKDVRNLITRVLPNHDRQYIKEKDVHETELAALRNHHDLLCTLFWAAPPDLRPSIQLVEKLVVPGSSHKEACLVNLRAWNQLARFTVSSGEDISAYKPLADWQRNVFQQVLNQYLSAESDVHQQFLRLSKDASRGISQTFMDSVVRANKKASMDVLHYSMKAVLDVMRHTRTLASASYVLNQYQLDQIFISFSSAATEPDWGTLRVAVDMVDYYTRRIEEFLRRQEDPSAADEAWHGEDAILLLERKVVTPFFSMARVIVRTDFGHSARAHTMDRIICLEETVLVAGRVAARLVHARLTGVSKFFSSGRVALFEGLLKSNAGPPRKLLPLFLATLIDKGVSDFKDLGVTALELFLAAITKPFQYLGYENRLAEAIKRHGDPYLEDAFIDVGKSPDYNSNRDLFSHTISRMRRSLRFAEPSQRQQLQPLFAKCIRTVMEQTKQDLKLLVPSPPEHANYIDFVRSVVGIIRAQDICPVDPFFYQISPEYSPSRQDPRLQTAGILACGLKLEEGSPHAAPGLFYLLWPNFTTALAGGRLADERAILERGMRHRHVLAFMLGKMLPAVVAAAVRCPDAWALAQTYVDALEARLAGPAVHRDLTADDDGLGATAVLALLRSAAPALEFLRALRPADLRTEYVYTLAQILRLLNLLAPSLRAYLINEGADGHAAGDVMRAVELVSGFTRCAGAYLYELLENDHDRAVQRTGGVIATAEGGNTTPQRAALTIDAARLFEGVRLSQQQPTPNPDDRDARLVSDFTAHMVREIGNGWVTVAINGPATLLLTVKGPARPPAASNPNTTSTQAAPASALAGTPVPRWDPRSLAAQLLEQIGRWNAVFGGGGGGGYEETAVSGVAGLGRRAGTWEDRWGGDDGLDTWF